MPNNYFFSAKLVAPNDPDYFNENMAGAFKFVWIGVGADPLYSGEVITDPKMINLFGNGMVVKIETADKTNFYPVPLEYFLQKIASDDMPKISLLLKLKRIIQDEILDLNLKSILNESEYNQTLLFL